jgi:excinuclease ABC subunit C
VISEAESFLHGLSGGPGVYRMLGGRGEVLYVGKARSLRKRLASYFRTGLPPRAQLLMQQVRHIEVTVTHSEGEALLLENNLIKALRPRFNVQLRDDKSYPYIFLSAQEYPRLAFHRGSRRAPGRYFGPFPSAAAVRESLKLLQKAFLLRQCPDSYFRNRARPCLQYQIGRCSAPCVGYIAAPAYRDEARLAERFLEGESRGILDELVQRMEQASGRHEYEQAARLRDRIAALRRIQERQYVSAEDGDADVVALVAEREAVGVSVMFIRAGRNLGTKQFFPEPGVLSAADDLLAAFLAQYYLGKSTPPALYVNHPPADRELLERAFAGQSGGRVRIVQPKRGAHRGWVRLAEINARDALRRQCSDRTNLRARFEALQEALGLDSLPERIECFDVSHTAGEAAVAACVAFGLEGARKSDYRRYNIEAVTAGDDYAALEQALTRRFRRALEPAPGHAAEELLPEVLLIDGGKGQLGRAQAVLSELQLSDIALVAVAKGPTRRPGAEQLFLGDRRRPLRLAPHSPALHLIQQIRDEAHRFAITGHRQRRGRARGVSVLERIPGVGAKRRQALLRNLGGLQEVVRAGVEDLARVPGISPVLARRIFDNLHEGEGR